MRLLIILAIGLGICFRFVNLDHKVYWYDEVITSLRSAGYSEAEVVQRFQEPALVSTTELLRYQQPAFDRGINATVASLIQEDPHHPPLYYGISYLWMRHVGSSVQAMRALSVLLSLWALPAMYWLCWELFVARQVFPASAHKPQISPAPPAARNRYLIDRILSRLRIAALKAVLSQPANTLVCWLAVALVAVSPFHILYAQESRQYGLWSVTILLATAALLRAMRVMTATSWALYVLTLTLSFYTFLLSGLVALAHGVYLLLLSRFRLTRTLLAYLVATIVSTILFLPWIWAVLGNFNQAEMATHWTGHERQWLDLGMRWLGMMGRLFYDTNTTGTSSRLLKAGCVFVVGVAFYQLCRRTPRSVWLLVVTLTGVPAFALILPDLLSGGMRSTVARYLIPTFLGVEVAVAYWLTATINSQRTATGSRCWQGIAIILLTMGVISGAAITRSPVWWTKTHGQEVPAVAQLINRTDHPLVISDARTGELLTLVHRLNADVALWVQPYCYLCTFETPEQVAPFVFQVPEGYKNVFLFHPRASIEWKQSIQNQRLPFRSVLSDKEVLWRLSSTHGTMAQFPSHSERKSQNQ